MEPKPTLFNFLHDTLVQQIVSGRIAYGEKLPPLRALCDIYHVGIRTVRDVGRTGERRICRGCSAFSHKGSLSNDSR